MVVRQRRIAELQAQAAGKGGPPREGPSAQEQEARQREMDERRRQILSQLLTPEARERVARIGLVKPDKARRVEDMIIGAAQSGQLRGKVDEANLISLLDQISKKQKHTTITYQRRKWNEDD